MTKKYDLSKIMKAAHKAYKNSRQDWSPWKHEKARYNGEWQWIGKMPFGYFLRGAWMDAKAELAKAEREAKERAERLAHRTVFDRTASFEGYFFKRWCGGANMRIYINGNGRANGTYIDVIDWNRNHDLSTALHGRRLSEETRTLAAHFVEAYRIA